ncbi:CHAT domain-containing protein [Nocardia brasiliensis]|uniref:CHAT domain-containing tetratricopeptide repeat protein n=1 Tax=Nocardia brasiliensis TaxID=37326 RepID=UPI0036710013
MSEKRYKWWARAQPRNWASGKARRVDGSSDNTAERAVATALMNTEWVEQADGLLFDAVGGCDPDTLLRELARLRDELRAEGRPAEADVAEFHRQTVENSLASLRRFRDLRHRWAEGGGPDQPLGFPEPVDTPRQLLEREASELFGRGELDAALAVLRRAERIPPSAPVETVGFAGLRMHVAGALRTAGRAKEALALLDTVEFGPHTGGVLAHEPGTRKLRSRFQHLRGLLCDDNGAYEDAQRSFRQAVEAAGSCGDLEAEYRARTDLAASYLKAGRSRAGVRAFRRVLEFVETNGGRRVGALINLGTAYSQIGDTDAARSCFEQALALLEAAGGEGNSMVNVLLGLGDLAADEGNEADAWDRYFQALLKSISPLEGVLQQSLPLVLSRAGKIGAAGDRLIGAAEVFLDQLDVTLDSSRGQVLLRLARAKRDSRAGRHAAAAAELRVAHKLVEQQPPSAYTRLMVLEQLADTLVGWAHERPQAHQEAFDLLWEARRRLLEAASDENVRDRPARVANYRGIYGRLIELLVDHGSALRLPAGQPPLELAFDLHEEYKTWTSGVGRETVTPARFAALRDWLRTHPDADDCAFVSYFCGSDTLTVFIHVPATGRLVAVRKPLARTALSRAAERLRRTFDGDPLDPFRGAPLPAKRPWRRSLAFLDELAPGLLAALPYVAGRELLCVAADGPIHELPLPALPMPGTGRPLVERHAVVQVGSATTLLGLAGLPPADGGGAVYVGAVAAHDDPDHERLERDADLVADSGRQVIGSSGIEATPDAVAAGLRATSVAHLAAHGWFDAVEPMDSGVLLAHDGQRPPRDVYSVDVGTRLDHLLTARRLARDGLRIDLLTLRACSTARRDVHDTGYPEGLVQALLHAGARTVVATLWDVDDSSSRRLFAEFYRNLSSDSANSAQQPWRALWAAQRAMLRDPDSPWESHPFHWAAVALFGLWRHT